MTKDGSSGHTLVVALVGAALALSGCGIGYRPAHHTVHAGKESPSPTYVGLDSTAGFSGTAITHEVTVYDTSGILLSVMGTTANATKARNEKLREMSKSGASSGSYTYEVTPVIPGMEFRAYYLFGGGSGFDFEPTGTDTTTHYDGDLKVSGFGVGFDIGAGHLTKRVLLDASADAKFVTYEVSGSTMMPLDQGYPVTRDPFYVPVNVGLSYLVTPVIRVRGGVGYDFLQSGFGLLLDGGQLFDAKAQAYFAPTSWLAVEAGIGYEHLSTGLGDYRSTVGDVQGWLGIKVMRR
jgi:hypothetical protein